MNLNNDAPEQETNFLLTKPTDTLALAEIQLDDDHWQRLREAYPYGCSHQTHSPFALAV